MAFQKGLVVVGFWMVSKPMPGSKVGERVKAITLFKKGARGINSPDLIHRFRESLAPYNVFRYIDVRDVVPKSNESKLLKREFKDEERRRPV